MNKRVLVIGSGGREHAIIWKLCQSQKVDTIYAAPGNVGICLLQKVFAVPINVIKNEEVVRWSIEHKIDLVVVGPEIYLANGLADALVQAGIKCFGPMRNAARIETNKEWSKKFMDRHNIPTARWKSFTNPVDAINFVKDAPFPARVIKASGLAAGKGVVLAKDENEACRAIEEILVEHKFGPAGNVIVVEEFMTGQEVSLLAFTDGTTIVPMLPAQDHKRLLDGDLGPNTGGMGAYCPCPLISIANYDIVRTDILQKAVDGLRKENMPFVGVLYAGLMMTDDGPKVLEFNCRFGDPEAQVLLPLLKSDFYNIMESCCEGTIDEFQVTWQEGLFATGVVLASQGYPVSSSKGDLIKGTLEVQNQGNIIFHGATDNSSGELRTNGGRVLIVVSKAPSLAESSAKATEAARLISFEGKQFRTDIGHKGIPRCILFHGKSTYKKSGVDIQAGDSFVSLIKPIGQTTARRGAIGAIGGFGGLFDVKSAGYIDPILVAGTDGVGTKLKIAFECQKHNTIGIDLVAMCANDLLAHGAEPLFFLDYFACSKLNTILAAQVVLGIAEGCRRAGCSLIGGETAEMPDMYAGGEYDLAGFAVGAVERSQVLPRIVEMEVDDYVIGLPSSGIHSNGYSLVRKVMKHTGHSYGDVFSRVNKSFGEIFLEPTKIYAKTVVAAAQLSLIKGFAHITGGGLSENIPRILPPHMGVTLDAKQWKIHPIFAWLSISGDINKSEMLRTFNCGIGAVLICSPANLERALDVLKADNPVVIGRVNHVPEGLIRVDIMNFEMSMEMEMRRHVPTLMNKLSKPLKRVAVLISGSGTNLKALIDATNDPLLGIHAQIVMVISNKADVEGLKRARNASISTKVLDHRGYPTRESYDACLTAALESARVDIVCLAGFMRILSESFVNRWRGSLINIHPSLLPSFKGANAHREVLESGVRVTGCTVHFVSASVDCGAIIEQAPVPVLPTDDLKTLQNRVKVEEHRIYPLALKYLANERIELRDDNTVFWRY